MKAFSKPKKVKLVLGLIYACDKAYKKALKAITKEFGPIDFESGAVEFNFTDYYDNEMGPYLERKFISLKRLIKRDDIINIKLWSIKLEKKLSILNKRRINIDPGYMTEAKLILTTTKDFSHRIYLGKGIFGEITLIYQDKKFKNLSWTFPDYRTQKYKKYFSEIRKLYRSQLAK